MTEKQVVRCDLIRASIERVLVRGDIHYQAVLRSNADDSVISFLGPVYASTMDAELESARQWNALQKPFNHAHFVADEDDLDDAA